MLNAYRYTLALIRSQHAAVPTAVQAYSTLFNFVGGRRAYLASGARREVRVAELVQQGVVQHLGQKRRYECGSASFGPAHDDLVVPLGAVQWFTGVSGSRSGSEGGSVAGTSAAATSVAVP